MLMAPFNMLASPLLLRGCWAIQIEKTRPRPKKAIRTWLKGKYNHVRRDSYTQAELDVAGMYSTC